MMLLLLMLLLLLLFMLLLWMLLLLHGSMACPGQLSALLTYVLLSASAVRSCCLLPPVMRKPHALLPTSRRFIVALLQSQNPTPLTRTTDAEHLFYVCLASRGTLLKLFLGKSPACSLLSVSVRRKMRTRSVSLSLSLSASVPASAPASEERASETGKIREKLSGLLKPRSSSSSRSTHTRTRVLAK